MGGQNFQNHVEVGTSTVHVLEGVMKHLRNPFVLDGRLKYAIVELHQLEVDQSFHDSVYAPRKSLLDLDEQDLPMNKLQRSPQVALGQGLGNPIG